MQYNLLTFLSELKDPRRAQGVRHPLAVFVALVILAILSGHQGLHGFARFCKSNEQELRETFSLKHGVPCYATIRTLLKYIDLQALCQSFYAWMEGYFPKDSEIWISLDGKALCSTVKNSGDSLQNFVYMVSAFAHHTDLVHKIATFQSSKSSEAAVVREMIAQLGLSQGVISLDAIHCQKKH
jgi:DDE_Tnp_1-associated